MDKLERQVERYRDKRTHEARRRNGDLAIVEADAQKADEAEFIVLAEGRIHFEGDLAALRSSTDPYLKKFLS